MKSSFLILVILMMAFSKPDIFAQASGGKEEAPLMKSIFFGGGSYYIDNEQILELEDFLANLPEIPQYTISIYSYTDNIGSVEYNNWLSQMRSESVMYELVLQNIPIENIFIKDFGEYNPVFDNSTMSGKRMNRRVDIIFEPIVF